MTPAGLDVQVAAETGRIALGRERAASVARAVLRAEGARRASISIAFVSNRRIAALNRRHLGHAGPTDVISFALAPAARGEVQGDIYIAPDVARDNALEHGVSVREELARLVVHGTRDARRALAPERDAARLRGDLHVEPGGRHTGENSAVTPPLDAG